VTRWLHETVGRLDWERGHLHPGQAHLVDWISVTKIQNQTTGRPPADIQRQHYDLTTIYEANHTVIDLFEVKIGFWANFSI